MLQHTLHSYTNTEIELLDEERKIKLTRFQIKKLPFIKKSFKKKTVALNF